MIRRIITIDEEKCNGCGLCAKACHEGAIGMVNGKAKLVREDYCDGLGDCLPACPVNAIAFEEREAPQPCGGPGSSCQSLPARDAAAVGDAPGCLTNFPVQIQLAPVSSPWFRGAELLIAADCTAYCCGNFHRDFIRGRVTLIGCPKLDQVNYALKLAEIFRQGEIRSVTLARMTVPCCGGLTHAVRTAIAMSGKEIPLRIVTISPDGRIVG